ncbi:hypothetical protein [Roseovarius sp.]|uniref:hypothetical protein n=1 Tax=Roseovarius sp. TaxID=1486281 RepID=UPI003BA8ECF5
MELLTRRQSETFLSSTIHLQTSSHRRLDYPIQKLRKPFRKLTHLKGRKVYYRNNKCYAAPELSECLHLTFAPKASGRIKQARASGLRIVFHIGTKKTGSTTLQHTFRAQAPLFREKGILYPDMGKRVHHTQLLFDIADDDELPGIFGRNSPEKIARSQGISRRLWEDVDRQIAESGCDTIVFSSEYAFGLRSHSLARLVQRLRAHSASVHLVGYFRSPVVLYRSALQQNLKYGHVIRNPQNPFDYGRRFRKIARLECDSVAVRCFERAALLNGCIVQDFCVSALQMEPAEAAGIPVTSANESVSAPAMTLLYDFNRVLFPGRRQPGRPINKRLLNEIQSLESAGTFSKAALRKEVVSEIELSHRNELLWLRDNASITFTDVDYDRISRLQVDPSQRRTQSGAPVLADVMELDTAEYEEFRSALLMQTLLKLTLAVKNSYGAVETARPLRTKASQSVVEREMALLNGHAREHTVAETLSALAGKAESHLKVDLPVDEETQIYSQMIRLTLVQLDKVTTQNP